MHKIFYFLFRQFIVTTYNNGREMISTLILLFKRTDNTAKLQDFWWLDIQNFG